VREFSNRRVVVIGGSRGIGYAVSRMLVARGARVAIGARDTAVLARVRDELCYEGATPYVGACDIADTLSTGAFINFAATRLGGSTLSSTVPRSLRGQTTTPLGWRP
jgi:3-oxoacyl-[acyl-carrier protein] reductase